MSFESVVASMVNGMALPLAERSDLRDELLSDAEALFSALVQEGASVEHAKNIVLQNLFLSSGDAASLEAIHNTRLFQFLRTRSKTARVGTEFVFSFLPLLITSLFIYKEVPMLEFIREGGLSTIVVLAIGSIAIYSACRRIYLWFVLKDHSNEVIRLSDRTPLFLAMATFLIGVLGAATNTYVVLTRWTTGGITSDLVPVGLKESVSTLIVGSCLATLTVLLLSLHEREMRRLRT